MGVLVELRVLELLNARLCHELISPVAAINNGIELMDEDDPGFAQEAMKLIASSAKTAGQRLNFYRFAYGSGRGSSGRDVALALLDGSKVKAEWNEAAVALPLEWQRLACNMTLLAAEVLPRGGVLQLKTTPSPIGITVDAAGDSLNLSAELRAAIGEKAAVDALTARTVHGYYTARIADALGARLTLIEPQAGRVVLTAIEGG